METAFPEADTEVGGERGEGGVGVGGGDVLSCGLSRVLSWHSQRWSRV